MDRGQVGGDKSVVGAFGLGGGALPAGSRAATDVGAAKAADGNVVDRVVGHGVVDGDLLAIGNRLAVDEVAGAGVVELDATVGAAGVIDLGAETAMPSPLGATHLGRVRVVAVDLAFEHPDHHLLTCPEATSRANATALAAFERRRLTSDSIQGTASQFG